MQAESDYLYYSRKLIYTSKTDMVKYFSSRINGRKALMIDLCGTGMHFSKLKKQSDLNFQILMMTHGADDGFGFAEQFYGGRTEVIVPKKWVQFGKHNVDDMTSDTSFYFMDAFKSDLPELFNRSTHNTPIKLNALTIDEKIIPDVIFSEISDTENLDVFERCMQEILKSDITWWQGKTTEESVEVSKKIVELLENFAQPVTLKFKHNLDGYVDRNFLYK